MRNLGEVVVVRQDEVVDAAEVADAAAAGGGEDDVAVVLVAEEGNDAVIVHAQERHDEMVVGECNSVGCKPHIDYFGKVNAVDTRPSSEPNVERGAE